MRAVACRAAVQPIKASTTTSGIAASSALLLPTPCPLLAGDVESSTTLNIDAGGGVKPLAERVEDAWELNELRLQLVAAEHKCKVEHDDKCKAVREG